MNAPPPPRLEQAETPKTATTTIERGRSLLDQLSAAALDTPDLRAARHRLRKIHWRTFVPPFAPGPPHPAVVFVALTTSATESNKAPAEMGSDWVPDVRTWNAAQGSFDGREALLAPPPSHVRFAIHVPPHARFRVAPTVVGLSTGSATFEVAVRPRGGARELRDTLVVSAGDAARWHERTIDLTAYGNQEVELELSTTTTFRGEPPATLWGEPTLIAPTPQELPYNILWVVVDALRPDMLSAWHPADRDQALQAAPLPPLEAWLPAMPSVAPALERLTATGVAFIDTTSAASWTRPGTVAMLSGMRSSELGLETTPWVLSDTTVERFYASRPPLLAPQLRQAGATTQAIVDNYFLTGYARAGIDLGFAAMIDHRDDRRDTELITRDALAWLAQHQHERFFLFLNFNSPHHPYTPDARHLAQVPAPPEGPTNPHVRNYLGEVAKDDAAVGRVLQKLDDLNLRRTTIVVVTADHGETLSAAHELTVPKLDGAAKPMRFHHANAMFEETVRIPWILSLPGRLPEGKRVRTPAQNTDIVPTVLALEGLPLDPRRSGRSLLSGVDQADSVDANLTEEPLRPIVSEGRAARSVRTGSWRYVERDPAAYLTPPTYTGPPVAEELYDLVRDPGERNNVARRHPDIVARLREQLAHAMARGHSREAVESAALAGSSQRANGIEEPSSRLHFRFAGSGYARRFSMRLEIQPTAGGAVPSSLGHLQVIPIHLDPNAVRGSGSVAIDAAMTALPATTIGLDVDVFPASASVRWSFTLDDMPLPPELLYVGTYALAYPTLLLGVMDADTRLLLTSRTLPLVNPLKDLGVFVSRDPAGDVHGNERAQGTEAAQEVGRLLETWGYAARPSTSTTSP